MRGAQERPGRVAIAVNRNQPLSLRAQYFGRMAPPVTNPQAKHVSEEGWEHRWVLTPGQVEDFFQWDQQGG